MPLTAPHPLSFMTKLDQNTFYLDPGLARSAGDPRLILVFPWMGAQDVHIAKYIAQHQALFPTSRILVVKYTLKLLLGETSQGTLLRPAVEVMRGFVREVKTAGGVELLVHVFSNGGVTTCVDLWQLLDNDVPRHVAVFDSCPGYHTWSRTYYTLSLPFPRILRPLVHIPLFILWLIRYPPPQDINAAKLNTEARVDREVRRTYLYGTGDEAVDWRDVERHAAEARTVAGDERVRLERFEGARHVALARADGGRYWGAVKESWEEKA